MKTYKCIHVSNRHFLYSKCDEVNNKNAYLRILVNSKHICWSEVKFLCEICVNFSQCFSFLVFYFIFFRPAVWEAKTLQKYLKLDRKSFCWLCCTRVWVYCVHFSKPSERRQKISEPNICFTDTVLLEEVTCDPPEVAVVYLSCAFLLCLRSTINNSLSPHSFLLSYKPLLYSPHTIILRNSRLFKTLSHCLMPYVVMQPHFIKTKRL